MQMRTAICAVISIFISFTCFSQDTEALKKTLQQAADDSTRCRILAQLAETAETSEWEKFNEELKAVSEKNIALHLPPSEEIIFKKYLAIALNNIGFGLKDKGESQKALEYYKKSLQVAQQINDKHEIANALNNAGIAYANLGNIAEAFYCYNRCLALRQESGDKKGTAYCLNNIGLLYKNQGDIAKALACYSRSLKIREETGDRKGIATALNNIGAIYNNQSDTLKALEYYKKSMAIREAINDKAGVAASLNNIAGVYRKQGKTELALEYFLKSLQFREEIGDRQGVATCLGNMSGIYKQKGNTKKALEYLQQSLTIREETGDKQGISESLNGIGGICISLAEAESSSALKKKKYSEALAYCTRSLNISRELGYPENIRNAAERLKVIYQYLNKPAQALEMYDLFIVMRDSIVNSETRAAAKKQQFRYEWDKKEAELKAAQEKKNAVNTKEKQKQRLILNFAFFCLAMVVAFAFFIFSRFRITRRQKMIIEKQKTAADNAFVQLNEKNKEVMDSIHYARRIQFALLTPEKYIERNLLRLRDKK
jgi:tetratricopeptide (TPR) repeat protein